MEGVILSHPVTNIASLAAAPALPSMSPGRPRLTRFYG